MQESFLKSLAVKFGFAILVIAFADLVFLNWWILKSEKKQPETNNGVVVNSSPLPSISSAASPTPTIQAVPSAQPSPTIAPISKPQAPVNTYNQTIVQTANKEIFIPLGSGSTNSNSYADLSGTDVSIDLTKYSGVQSIVFQASVWVDGGNGRAYARIINVDDNNPYFESQISSNSGAGSVQNSTNIPMPYSTKVYRIQAKTDITNFAAHIENARIKITLK